MQLSHPCYALSRSDAPKNKLCVPDHMPSVPLPAGYPPWSQYVYKRFGSTKWATSPSGRPSPPFHLDPPFIAVFDVNKPPTWRPSPPSHVGAVKPVRRVTVGVPKLAAHVVAGLLRGVHLSLQRGRIGVDPLELLEVAVEHTNDLAELQVTRVSHAVQTDKCQSACSPYRVIGLVALAE